MSTVEAHMEKAARRLRVAERLLQEGEYEDSTSRAYYAMYHAARAALATVNVFPRTHEGLVSEFGKRFVLTGTFPKELGRALADVKAARETYEYSVTTEIEETEAESTLEDAREFVAAVDRFDRSRKG